MSLDGITGSGNVVALRGTDAVARVGGALPAPVARPRSSPLDGFQIAGRPGSQRPKAAPQPQRDDDSAPSSNPAAKSPSRTVSAFVAQSLAQEQEQGAASPVPVSRIAAGIRAYARSSGTTAPQTDAGIEIIPPQLSSGHALDLAV